MKRNIVLDCDPGHDDAVAILLAGKNPNLNLLGISVVAGNQTIEKTARNALNVATFLGINVPIAIGCEFPMVRERVICAAIHGESGLDGFEFPNYGDKFDKRHGVQLIIDSVMNNDKVTIVATGPLTNVAMAIKMEPKILERLDEIVIMGGSVDNGNTSPAAEFNIMCDPEAAHVVFSSGVTVRMVGLNVTRKVTDRPNSLRHNRSCHRSISRTRVLIRWEYAVPVRSLSQGTGSRGLHRCLPSWSHAHRGT